MEEVVLSLHQWFSCLIRKLYPAKCSARKSGIAKIFHWESSDFIAPNRARGGNPLYIMLEH